MREQVDLERRDQRVMPRCFVQPAARRCSGVRDHDVEPAETGDGEIEQRGHVAFVAHVAGADGGARAVGDQCGGGRP
jgi:hypothetical protein